MLFFFKEALPFDGVATEGLGFASESIATSETIGYGVGGFGRAAGGSAGGFWDEVLAATAKVGIGGSDGSLGLIFLSMIREKYKSSSMLVSWAKTLSYLRSRWPCFSLVARSSALKK